MNDYDKFLQDKKVRDIPTGISGDIEINIMLFGFQRDIVLWALRRGRACIWADCGLGKTPMQLEWARHVCDYTKGNVLILAPLAVSEQTCREGTKFGIPIKHCKDQSEVASGITITNYERIHSFDLGEFAGVVLDESSILKHYTGAFRNAIIEQTAEVQFKLACTATPSPNDFMELGNHSEFIGAMTRTEMLSMFFIHDGGDTQKWRLKGHALGTFWEWVCSWAVMIKKPSDLGYCDDGFILPSLSIDQVVVETKQTGDYLFQMDAKTLSERQQARRTTIEARAGKAAELIKTKPNEKWLVWCNLNNEASAIKSMIEGCINVQGSDSDEKKARQMMEFGRGEIDHLVTKPKIAGMGMNWQSCHNVIFLGLSDSFEQYYQCVRRCWRFGQKKDVNVYIVTADIEGRVVQNIKRKEAESDLMAREMLKNMKSINTKEIHGMTNEKAEYKTAVYEGKNFTAHLGDSCEIIKTIETESIGYSIFSPPFASLYTYSNSDRDMGNCKSNNEFTEHFKFIVDELFRVMQKGRNVSFHCMNLPTSKARDGFIGIRDFRGDMIKLFQQAGFIFHSEVCIWKNPVTAMQRTKALGLLHKQVKKDSCMSRQGIPDYLVTMRKPGVNEKPVAGEFDFFHGDMKTFKNTGNMSIDIWQRYASPVWMDINPSNTLQYRAARDNNDERHICPLQLDVIERGMQLWSAEGDKVYTPFGGIGSEGFIAVKRNRYAILSELKESYYDVLIKNMRHAEDQKEQQELF